MSTRSIHTEVAAYAEAVRAAMAGLDPDEVTDLTDGLEADLSDALADTPGWDEASPPDLVAHFGDPAAYAAELRTAAGLAEPAPVAGPREPRLLRLGRTLLAPLLAVVRAVRRLGVRTLAVLRAQPWWAPVEAFFVSLRPVWWVVRGWVLFQMLWQTNGYGPFTVIPPPDKVIPLTVLLVIVVVSVQWGRGLWLPSRAEWLRTTASVIAALWLLPMGAVATTVPYQEPIYISDSGYVDPGYVGDGEDGVVVDGMRVSNLFVYDAEGNPLRDVQIFDDRGRQVRTVTPEDEGWRPWYLPSENIPWFFVPVTDSEGRERWNVYPLRGAPESDVTFGNEGMPEPMPGGRWRVPPWPFAKATPLQSAAEPEPSPTADEASAGAGVAPDATAPTDGTTTDGTAPTDAVTAPTS